MEEERRDHQSEDGPRDDHDYENDPNHLPVHKLQQEIVETVRNNDIVILTGETGWWNLRCLGGDIP